MHCFPFWYLFRRRRRLEDIEETFSKFRITMTGICTISFSPRAPLRLGLLHIARRTKLVDFESPRAVGLRDLRCRQNGKRGALCGR